MSFPAITVGLAVWLFIVYALYFRTRDPVYLQIYPSGRRSSLSDLLWELSLGLS